MKKIKSINSILFVVFIIIFFTFVLSPPTGDIHVFVGGARLADYFEKNWIYNSFNQWELKGVFNRLLTYSLYRISIFYTGKPNISFDIIYTLIYSFFSIGLLGVSVKLANPTISISKKIQKLLYLCIGIFATQTMSKMQTEMTCCILLIVGFSLYINAIITNRYTILKMFLAGLLIGSTFFFKSILILLSIAFIAGTYLWNEKNNFKYKIKNFFILTVGGLTMLIIGFGLILLIYPEEIINIFSAASFQHTLLSPNNFSLKKSIIGFSYGLGSSSIGTPLIFIGILFAIKQLYYSIVSKRFDLLFFRILIWAIPALILLLANTFFFYQYYILVLPSILEVVLYSTGRKLISLDRIMILKFLIILVGSTIILQVNFEFLYIEKLNRVLALFTLLFYFVYFMYTLTGCIKFVKYELILPLLFLSFIYINYISFFSINFKDYFLLNKKAYTINNSMLSMIDKDEVFLYLDDGRGAYYLGNRTQLKYYYPLPLQRFDINEDESKSWPYQNSLNQIMGYEGKYISLYKKWFFNNNKNRNIQERIISNYTEKYKLAGFSVPSNIFAKTSQENITYFSILERK